MEYFNILQLCNFLSIRGQEANYFLSDIQEDNYRRIHAGYYILNKVMVQDDTEILCAVSIRFA